MATTFDPSKYTLEQLENIIAQATAHKESARTEALKEESKKYMTFIHNAKHSLVEAVLALAPKSKLDEAGITISEEGLQASSAPKQRAARLSLTKGKVYKNPNPKGRELKEFTGGEQPVPKWLRQGIEAGTIDA